MILIINTIRSYISVYFGIHYYLFDWTYHWKKKILIKKKERKKKNWCLKKRKKKKKRSKKQKIFFSQIYPISISFLSFIHSYCSIWWCFCWKWSPWSYFWCKLLFFDFIVFFKPKKKNFFCYFVILLFTFLIFDITKTHCSMKKSSLLMTDLLKILNPPFYSLNPLLLLLVIIWHSSLFIFFFFHFISCIYWLTWSLFDVIYIQLLLLSPLVPLSVV